MSATATLFFSCHDPLTVELLAILEALKFGTQSSFFGVDLVTDSLNAI